MTVSVSYHEFIKGFSPVHFAFIEGLGTNLDNPVFPGSNIGTLFSLKRTCLRNKRVIKPNRSQKWRMKG